MAGGTRGKNRGNPKFLNLEITLPESLKSISEVISILTEL